jgi:Holliday junction resolvasome RuvABC DNA-binding subunit
MIDFDEITKRPDHAHKIYGHKKRPQLNEATNRIYANMIKLFEKSFSTYKQILELRNMGYSEKQISQLFAPVMQLRWSTIKNIIAALKNKGWLEINRR